MYKIFVKVTALNGNGIAVTVIDFDNKADAELAYAKLIKLNNSTVIKLFE